ncbi:MAG: FTR1 family protein [Clostridia bacterium]|nr:FTR1 family protein [Clostridia bacterium]
MVKRFLKNNLVVILLVLAIALCVASPFINAKVDEVLTAYAAGEGETMHGESGVDYYREYRIYEQLVNKDGKHPVSFSDVATQIANVYTEAAYQYKKDTSKSDLFRRALYYWYETSGFSEAIVANVSESAEAEVREAFSYLYTNASNATLEVSDMEAKIALINSKLTEYAKTLDDNGVKTVTFHKEAELDAAYYLSYNAYKKAADKAGITLITYTEVAKQIGNLLDEGLRRYEAGESDYYVCFSNCYGYWYETSGFERKTMAYISGSRVTAVELQFAKVKEVTGNGNGTTNSVETIKAQTDALKEMLNTDGDKLDDILGYKAGSSGNKSLGVVTFLGCFTILIREGLEAILIVGAIIAYLVKAGEKKKAKYAYLGAGLGVLASVIVAVILFLVSNYTDISTAVPQEIIEGVTALIAVVVLIYVSNWMISKAESDSWTKYIKGKVAGSVDKGKVWSLAFTSFLAVFREGAEVILFYQPLVASAKEIPNGGWAIAGGIIAGFAVVALVFVLIRVFGVKIPLKPFFLGTSILIAIMSIIFLGQGIWELFIDGGIWPVGIISGIEGWAENEVLNFFGIYPTWLTIIPQIVLTVVTIVTFVLWIVKGKKDKQKAMAQAAAEEASTEPIAAENEAQGDSENAEESGEVEGQNEPQESAEEDGESAQETADNASEQEKDEAGRTEASAEEKQE